MPITFLHAADIHLDSPLRGLERYEGAPVDRIRGASRRAFENLIDLALEKKVDFVLIAGDLFDGDWKDYNTGLYLVRQLQRLRAANIPTLMISGNHDAANKMTRSLPLPDNVVLFDPDRAETHRLKGIDVAVHGQSFAHAAVTENLAMNYPARVAGCFNIGLLHTGLTGLEGHDRYAPCTIDDLRSKDYGYWALGHIHLRQDQWADPPIVFPGNAQGRHVRETGEKGCLLATIQPDQSVTRAFHRLDVLRWERGMVDAAEIDDLDELFECAAAKLDQISTLETDSERLIAVRLTIQGATSLNDRLRADPDRLINGIRSLTQTSGRESLWLEKVEIQTKPLQSHTLPDGPIEEIRDLLDQLREDPSPLARELDDLRKKLSSVLKQDADDLKLSDLDHLREVLDDVQPLLFELLLHPDRTGVS